ncbi:MAG: transglycosylase domain-containing protein [Bacteroidales bacterium]|nr:transglycosylase domain-containing protein [Bacteroidales bacterium]
MKKQESHYKVVHIGLLILIYIFCLYMFFYHYINILPNNLFSVSYSTVIKDENGELLSAIIADDKQWRFPTINMVPEKFKTCIIQYEDARFFYHLGFDIPSLIRALYKNIKHQKNC